MDQNLKLALQKKLEQDFLASDDPKALKYRMCVDFLDQLLSNYMVIGFDLDNEPFVLGKNNNPKDCEALRSLIHKVVTGGHDLNNIRF